MSRLTAIIALQNNEKVHSPSFCDILAKQPQALLIALLGCDLLRQETLRVIRSRFESSCPAWPRSDALSDGEQRQGGRRTEIWSGRCQDDEELRRIGGDDSYCYDNYIAVRNVDWRGICGLGLTGSRSDYCGSDVEAVSRKVGDPSGVNHNQTLDES